jgi:hypothetical protein
MFGTALLQARSQQLRDRCVRIHDFQDHLQAVDNLVLQELRKPWLLVNFK